MTHRLTPRPGTAARVGLARAGGSVATADHLGFQAAHAAARDAVAAALDVDGLRAALPDAIRLRSSAPDRAAYLRRPDLGRRLRDQDRARLPRAGGVVVVVADGLSATAANRHAAAVIAALPFPVALTVLVEQGRVAVGDDIGVATGAEAVVVLIGERPGLSAADSLGAYITWRPTPGTTDAQRNCVSNIRPDGLAPELAARTIGAILAAARVQQVTGVALRVETQLTARTQSPRL